MLIRSPWQRIDARVGQVSNSLVRDLLPPDRRAEHFMGMPAASRPWTLDEVREMQDEERPWPRFELIDGELLVTPSPSRAHQLAVAEIFSTLREYVKRYSLGVVELSPADIQLNPATIVQPDIFVSPLVNGRISLDWRDTTSLLLAVEVLSPSSVRADRVIKRRFYARHEVDEYWVVDLDGRIIERTKLREERPEILDQVLTWAPKSAPEPLVIQLEPLFRAIYGEDR